ncbi:MAG: hypothetical protein COV67_08090 [Nitrospinae bacterium CG11_big_fil_rev_8_21_14_0_20_56_8]|nr:MAG: hypothetical protein COV67_08090 [Nitrospinae bacterium CG11_big_fil_rev_8_21_14_0_20_56_8]
MFGFPPDIVFWLTLSIFLGGLAKGVSGVAMPIVTLAIALNFVDGQTGLALVILPIVLSNIWQVSGNGSFMQPIKRFWALGVVFLCALYAGSQFVTLVAPWVLIAMTGASAVIFSGSQLYRPNAKPLSPRAEKIIGPVAGLIAGIMGGMTSIWGPPIMMFLFMLKLDKDLWVRSVTSIYLLGAVPLAAFYFYNGVLSGSRLDLSLAACVPAMAGVLIGERSRRYINEVVFRKLLLIAIFIVGLNMLRRALFGL